jgi:hypothetical protein
MGAPLFDRHSTGRPAARRALCRHAGAGAQACSLVELDVEASRARVTLDVALAEMLRR